MRASTIAPALFAAGLAFAPGSATAAEPPKKGAAKKADPDAYAKSLVSDAHACGTICLDELDILLFGGVITVPFERPNVEQCGIWMSATSAERAQELSSRRKEAGAEAQRLRYSAREKEELKKRAVEPIKRCEADFKRRCEDARANTPLEARKKALQAVHEEIERLPEDARREALKKYLKNVLTACPLGE